MNNLASEQIGLEPGPTTAEHQLATAGEVTVELVTDEPLVEANSERASHSETEPTDALASEPEPLPPPPDLVAFLETEVFDLPATPAALPAPPRRKPATPPTQPISHPLNAAHALERNLAGAHQ